MNTRAERAQAVIGHYVRIAGFEPSADPVDVIGAMVDDMWAVLDGDQWRAVIDIAEFIEDGRSYGVITDEAVTS